MLINLNELEIIQAIREYIELQGIPLAGKSVDVRLKAGRGVNGHSAKVDISTPGVTEVAETEPDSNGPEEEQQAILFGDIPNEEED
jgi:hypothetical protein